MNTFSRSEITKEKIELVRKLIADNPEMGRSRLSVMLCEIWGWHSSDSKTKDMSYRALTPEELEGQKQEYIAILDEGDKECQAAI